LGSAFHRLWRQRQEADEFWLHRIGGDSLDIGRLEVKGGLSPVELRSRRSKWCPARSRSR
jgi:hypothetical protein